MHRKIAAKKIVLYQTKKKGQIMNYTKDKIFNMTLKNLRVSIGLQMSNPADKNSVVLNEYYETAKNQALKDFDWNFASAYRELALTGNIPVNPRFLYEYDYPNDCLFAREIIPYGDTENMIEFEIASNTTGQRVINTNQAPVVLRYTRCIDNETFFTDEFVSALCWQLAFLAAPAITGNSSIQNSCMNVYSNMIAKARTLNASEGYIKAPDRCSWFDARYINNN